MFVTMIMMMMMLCAIVCLLACFVDAATVYSNHLTFSGFLNALDGVVSSEGRIIFMTTNHLDRLDPALLRPGRVDMRALIDNASTHQIRRMFLRFYERQYALADQFVDRVRHTPISTAQLQGHFVFHKQDARAALQNAHWLLAGTNTSADATIDSSHSSNNSNNDNAATNNNDKHGHLDLNQHEQHVNHNEQQQQQLQQQQEPRTTALAPPESDGDVKVPVVMTK